MRRSEGDGKEESRFSHLGTNTNSEISCFRSGIFGFVVNTSSFEICFRLQPAAGNLLGGRRSGGGPCGQYPELKVCELLC